MCDNECISKGKCEHNEECHDYVDVYFSSEQSKVVEKLIAKAKENERTKTIDEMAEIITELNDDTTICNSFNCPRADEPITCTMCILERVIKQMKKE